MQSVDILSATTTTTTKITIESLQIEGITLERMTREGAGDWVEAVALPTPSPYGRMQRSGEMGIIRRDGQEFCPQGEGGIRTRRGGGGRPPNMAGRHFAEAWRT